MFTAKIYRLIDVTDHKGKSKVDENSIYQHWIGCVAKNIRKQEYYGTRHECVHMEFFLDSTGEYLHRTLRTSPVTEIRELGHGIQIRTTNNVYVLEEFTVSEPETEQNSYLIELWLDNSHTNFCRGYFYSPTGNHQGLYPCVHLGMNEYSVLLNLNDDSFPAICRYYPGFSEIKFFNTPFHRSKHKTQILIHNVGEHVLHVTFRGAPDVYKIMSGGNLLINPPDEIK